MMRAPRFRYFGARSVGDAVAALHAEGPDAMPLGGGTDLVRNLKRRQQTPRVLVGLRGIERLRALSVDAAGIRLGSGVTLTELCALPAVREHHGALFRAAAQVATPLLRNMGTLGGNLCLDTRCNYYNQNYEWRQAIDFCMKAPRGPAIAKPEGGVCWVAPGSPRCWAVSSCDTAPALGALGASLRLSSAFGERTIPVLDLYADDGMTHLTKRPDELLVDVVVPIQPGWRSTYWKLRRRGAFDFPVLGVAAAVKLGAGGVVEAARVVLGAVASRPIAVATESLIGRRLDDDAIAAFAEEAARLAKPLDNTDFALGWRKRIARYYVAGALRELRGDDPRELGLLARRAVALAPYG
jgi:4-hydroxybenzoyl-CoA reductase subunit beta